MFKRPWMPGLAPVIAGAIALAVVPAAGAADEAPAPEHAHHHHHHDTSASGQADAVKRSVAEYALPDVTLVRDDGRSVRLPAEIDDGRPVLMTFIYTTCTAVCPVVTQTFAQFQSKLGDEMTRPHMVSISIDPEQDTPARLREYAQRFGAGPQWQHYTGTSEASVAVQRAFNVYRGDKMNHAPVAFLRAAPGRPWVRFDGFASPAELLAEYHTAVASAK